MHQTCKWSRVTEIARSPRRRRQVRIVTLTFSRSSGCSREEVTQDEIELLNEIVNPMVGVLEVRSTPVASLFLVVFAPTADKPLIDLAIKVMCNRMQEHVSFVIAPWNEKHDDVLAELAALDELEAASH